MVSAVTMEKVLTSTKNYNPESELSALKIFLPAVKYAPLQEPMNEYCFILNTTFNINNDNLVFTITIKDKPQEDYGYLRYGENSEIKGKQSVDFLLLGVFSKDLFRFRRGLKKGETNILISPNEETLFKLCLHNYVYDGSWNSHDIDKYITINVSRFEQYQNRASRFVASTYHGRVFENIEEIGRKITGITGNKGYKKLIKIEEDRRNKNENTFDKLLYAMIIYTWVVLVSGVLQVLVIKRLLLI
ncbi:hypothetical protein C6P45_000482 [Maudiozyma exigua]|uniref:GOLD domain-containing protein n=1 Tax=Maudiozyma exigua TaxID=34358 RepID=A0A9P6W5F6_MAUEX|nr:hypothetical protein C6P45_000482 [Kazachstania exigua]